MKLSTYNAAEAFTTVAIADGVEIDASDFQDERVVLIFDVTTLAAGATMFIKGGDAFSEGSMADIPILCTAVAKYAVCVETARVKDADGNINIAVADIGALAGTIAVIQLP